KTEKRELTAQVAKFVFINIQETKFQNCAARKSPLAVLFVVLPAQRQKQFVRSADKVAQHWKCSSQDKGAMLRVFHLRKSGHENGVGFARADTAAKKNFTRRTAQKLALFWQRLPENALAFYSAPFSFSGIKTIPPRRPTSTRLRSP